MSESRTRRLVRLALQDLARAEVGIEQARVRLAAISTGATDVALDTRTADRVARFGQVAHLHREEGASLTRRRSLEIRRELFGDAVQSTANLFGRKGEGALFYRDRPTGSKVRDDDPVRLTAEGERIADLWAVQNLVAPSDE